MRAQLENISLFFLSLLLAFFFWAVAVESEDRTVVDVYPSTIPVAIEGLPKGMVVTEGEDARVQVTLRAPQSVWRTLQPEAIHVWVDLSDAVTGTVTVPVSVEVERHPVEIVNIVPERLSFTVESIASKDVPVTVILKGSPAVGYKVGSPTVEPQSVHVEGPASQVARVERAVLVLSIQGYVNEVEGDFKVAVVDAKEHAVPNVEVVPRTVSVRVPITSLGFFRDVPVSVVLQDRPAPGYRLVNLEVVPQVVKIVGRTAVVRSVRYLQTEPVSLRGFTRSLTLTLPLQIPDGVSIIAPASSYVTVSIGVEVIRSSLTLEVEPQIRGLSPGLTATTDLKSIFVLVSGPYSLTEQITATNVSLVLDLSGLGAGDYTIEPLVSVPPQVEVENVIPELVPVSIRRVPTPTPEVEEMPPEQP